MSNEHYVMESGSDFDIPVYKEKPTLGVVHRENAHKGNGDGNGARKKQTTTRPSDEYLNYAAVTADEIRARIAQREADGDDRPMRLHLHSKDLEQMSLETVQDLYCLICEKNGHPLLEIVYEEDQAATHNMFTHRMENARDSFYTEKTAATVSMIAERLSRKKKTTINHLSWQVFSKDILVSDEKRPQLLHLEALFAQYPQLLSFREANDYREFQSLCRAVRTIDTLKSLRRAMLGSPSINDAKTLVLEDDDLPEPSDADSITVDRTKIGLQETFDAPVQPSLVDQLDVIGERLATLKLGKAIVIPNLKQGIRRPENREHLERFVCLYRENPGKIILKNPDDVAFIDGVDLDPVTLALSEVPNSAEQVVDANVEANKNEQERPSLQTAAAAAAESTGNAVLDAVVAEHYSADGTARKVPTPFERMLGLFQGNGKNGSGHTPTAPLSGSTDGEVADIINALNQTDKLEVEAEENGEPAQTPDVVRKEPEVSVVPDLPQEALDANVLVMNQEPLAPDSEFLARSTTGGLRIDGDLYEANGPVHVPSIVKVLNPQGGKVEGTAMQRLDANDVTSADVSQVPRNAVDDAVVSGKSQQTIVRGSHGASHVERISSPETGTQAIARLTQDVDTEVEIDDTYGEALRSRVSNLNPQPIRTRENTGLATYTHDEMTRIHTEEPTLATDIMVTEPTKPSLIARNAAAMSAVMKNLAEKASAAQKKTPVVMDDVPFVLSNPPQKLVQKAFAFSDAEETQPVESPAVPDLTQEQIDSARMVVQGTGEFVTDIAVTEYAQEAPIDVIQIQSNNEGVEATLRALSGVADVESNDRAKSPFDDSGDLIEAINADLAARDAQGVSRAGESEEGSQFEVPEERGAVTVDAPVKGSNGKHKIDDETIAHVTKILEDAKQGEADKVKRAAASSPTVQQHLKDSNGHATPKVIGRFVSDDTTYTDIANRAKKEEKPGGGLLGFARKLLGISRKPERRY